MDRSAFPREFCQKGRFAYVPKEAEKRRFAASPLQFSENCSILKDSRNQYRTSSAGTPAAGEPIFRGEFTAVIENLLSRTRQLIP